MAKKLIITGGLIILIIILVLLAQRPAITPAPEDKQLIAQPEPTPRAIPETIPEPTPRAQEPEPTEPGVKLDVVYPDQVTFWVNEIRVPETYYSAQFIPIQEDNIKTFAGSFGPYPENPAHALRVVLCAEFTKVPAAPACEPVPLAFQDGYVTFARGYQEDEFIGAMAAKDYAAYYVVYAKETPVAYSNKAIIRTVRG